MPKGLYRGWRDPFHGHPFNIGEIMIDIGTTIEDIEYGQEVYNNAADIETQIRGIRILVKASQRITDAIVDDGKTEELIEAMRYLLRKGN